MRERRGGGERVIERVIEIVKDKEIDGRPIQLSSNRKVLLDQKEKYENQTV